MESFDETKRTIHVLIDGKLTPVIIENIMYCEADGDYTLIYMFNKLFPANQKPAQRASGHLLEIEKLIGSNRFVRIGRSKLVNADYYIHAKCRARKAFVLLQNEVRRPIPYRIFDDIEKELEAKKKP